jgi:Type II secretion system (T2SS), protein E, N-terminal domain
VIGHNDLDDEIAMPGMASHGKERSYMTRTPRSSADEPSLSHRLQWHANQSLRRGLRCSLLVLQPLGDSDHDCPTATSDVCAPSNDVPSRLAAVAAQVRTVVRHTDVVEVDEGTGIGIVLPDADAEGARIVHQRVCRALSEGARLRAASDADDADDADDAALRLGVGVATTEPTDGIRLAALARQLVCVASAPDLWITVRLSSVGERTTSARRGRVHLTAHGPIPIVHLATRRGNARLESPELTAASTSEECEELRRRADALGVPYVCLPQRLPSSLRRVLHADLARELSAVPIGRTRGILTVAMLEPTNLSAMQRLASATGLTIFPVLASSREVAHLLDQLAADVRPGERGRQPAQV